MYERSAIVLERYLINKFGLNDTINLKTNYNNFKEIIEDIQKFHEIVEEEEKVINTFDEVAGKLQLVQKQQEKLSKSNQKYEEDRIQLFSNIDDNPDSIEKKLNKIEENMEKNNEQIKILKVDFIQYLADFIDKQKERNKYAKARRIAEANHLAIVEKANNEIAQVNLEYLRKSKNFISEDTDALEREVISIMIKNGRDEKISFNEEVIKKAVYTRILIAKNEMECYVMAYERMRRLLSEINSDSVKISKYQKAFRDLSVKLRFLDAEKGYIVGFLDNERMTAINGSKVHKKMMEEACNNFEEDLIQINNLYQLVLREISNKSTKKAYRELYNKTYLRSIEDKEKNFEEEVNNIKINMGTIINSNYWRIEGIKNIYDIFQKEISEKFERDLSEFKLDDDMDEDITTKISDASEIFNDNNTNLTENKETHENELNEDLIDYDYDFLDEDDEDKFNDEEFDDDDDDDEYGDDEDEEDEYEDDDEEDYEEDIEEGDDEDEDDGEDEDEDDDYEDEDDDYEKDDVDDENDEDSNILANEHENDKKGFFNKFFKDKRK